MIKHKKTAPVFGAPKMVHFRAKKKAKKTDVKRKSKTKHPKIKKIRLSKKDRKTIFSEGKPLTSKQYFKQIKFNPKMTNNQELNFMIKSIEFNNSGLNPKIIQAFQTIDRALFVSHHSYEDMPIHIAHGQTISQPTTIARMLNLLRLEPEQNVLEIGTNTGYHSALAAYLVSPGNVTSVEIFPDLAHKARINVKNLLFDLQRKYKDPRIYIQIFTGDALDKKNEIWSKTYDRVYYTAHIDPEQVNHIKKLAKRALNDDGFLLFPTGQSNVVGRLELWQKHHGHMILIKKDEGYAFVPVVRQKDVENYFLRKI